MVYHIYGTFYYNIDIIPILYHSIPHIYIYYTICYFWYNHFWYNEYNESYYGIPWYIGIMNHSGWWFGT